MSICLRIILVSFLSLAVVGCAQAPHQFGKIGASKKFVKRDSDRCWKHAQTANETKAGVAAGAATTIALGLLTASPGLIVGGLVGQGINESSPKSSTKRIVHDNCMRKKGYKVKKA